MATEVTDTEATVAGARAQWSRAPSSVAQSQTPATMVHIPSYGGVYSSYGGGYGYDYCPPSAYSAYGSYGGYGGYYARRSYYSGW
ncbi:hypothetical protein [Bradyrhizobium sp. USDA 3650]